MKLPELKPQLDKKTGNPETPKIERARLIRRMNALYCQYLDPSIGDDIQVDEVGPPSDDFGFDENDELFPDGELLLDAWGDVWEPPAYDPSDSIDGSDGEENLSARAGIDHVIFQSTLETEARGLFLLRSFVAFFEILVRLKFGKAVPLLRRDALILKPCSPKAFINDVLMASRVSSMSTSCRTP